jgi:hypothetical protein
MTELTQFASRQINNEKTTCKNFFATKTTCNYTVLYIIIIITGGGPCRAGMMHHGSGG